MNRADFVQNSSGRKRDPAPEGPAHTTLEDVLRYLQTTKSEQKQQKQQKQQKRQKQPTLNQKPRPAQ